MKCIYEQQWWQIFWWWWYQASKRRSGGPLGGGGNGPLRDQNPRSYTARPIGPWIRPTWNPWYPPGYHVQPPIAPNPLPSKKYFPYPIYIVGTNRDAHVRIIHKAIKANGEKKVGNIVNMFCFYSHYKKMQLFY
jgi:hypothetical protein